MSTDTFYDAKPSSDQFALPIFNISHNIWNRLDVIISKSLFFSSAQPISIKEDSDPISISSQQRVRGIELVDKIHKIFNNPDNWDGFGTPKISDELKDRCFDLLELICQHNVELPKIFPVCGGGLQFEWQLGEKELEIEFNENTIATLRTRKTNGKVQYIEDENVTLSDIHEIVSWLSL